VYTIILIVIANYFKRVAVSIIKVPTKNWVNRSNQYQKLRRQIESNRATKIKLLRALPPYLFYITTPVIDGSSDKQPWTFWQQIRRIESIGSDDDELSQPEQPWTFRRQLSQSDRNNITNAKFDDELSQLENIPTVIVTYYERCRRIVIYCYLQSTLIASLSKEVVRDNNKILSQSEQTDIPTTNWVNRNNQTYLLYRSSLRALSPNQSEQTDIPSTNWVNRNNRTLFFQEQLDY